MDEAERDCGESRWCKQLPYTVHALEEQSRAWFSRGPRQEEGCAFLACPPFSVLVDRAAVLGSSPHRARACTVSVESAFQPSMLRQRYLAGNL